MPNILALKETIKSQERLIKNLQETTQDKIKNLDHIGSKEASAELEKLKFEKNFLNEKHKQVINNFYYFFYLNIEILLVNFIKFNLITIFISITIYY